MRNTAIIRIQSFLMRQNQTPALLFLFFATGRRMTVVCGDDSTVINDVVVGEVWFCSGQSNMTVLVGVSG